MVSKQTNCRVERRCLFNFAGVRMWTARWVKIHGFVTEWKKLWVTSNCFRSFSNLRPKNQNGCKDIVLVVQRIWRNHCSSLSSSFSTPCPWTYRECVSITLQTFSDKLAVKCLVSIEIRTYRKWVSWVGSSFKWFSCFSSWQVSSFTHPWFTR